LVLHKPIFAFTQEILVKECLRFHVNYEKRNNNTNENKKITWLYVKIILFFKDLFLLQFTFNSTFVLKINKSIITGDEQLLFADLGLISPTGLRKAFTRSDLKSAKDGKVNNVFLRFCNMPE